MFTSEANKQLQCFPSPAVYSQSGGNRFLFDRNNVMLALLGLEAFGGFVVSPAADQSQATINLVSMLVNGAQPATVDDGGKSNLSLASLSAILADSFTAPTENNIVALSLVSLSAITAQIAAAQTENSGASLALQSMEV